MSIKGKIIVSVLILISLAFNFYQHNLIKKNIEQISKQEKRIDALNDALIIANKRPPLHPIEVEVRKCMDGTGSTTKMAACVLDSVPSWKKEIETYVKKLKPILTDEEYALFLDSQKKWVEYSSSKVRFIEKAYGNSRALLYLDYGSASIAGTFEERARNLKVLFNHMENREPFD